MKFITSFCLYMLMSLAVVSCQNGPGMVTDEHSSSDSFINQFSGFPDTLFNQVYLDQNTEYSRQCLSEAGFNLIDSSGAWRYLRVSDSCEVILSQSLKLNTMKMYLRSRVVLADSRDLKALFSLDAVSEFGRASFTIYRYEQGFKLSCFEEPDQIRLNFEQNQHR